MINPITNNPTSILSENMNTITVAIPPKIKDKMKRVDSILGVIYEVEEIESNEIVELIDKRNKARDNKDWDSADTIRKELDSLGVVLEDTPEGTIWKKK